jgi:L-ascorbate metabolism protein UlaG (beta-lactamase superfamily)
MLASLTIAATLFAAPAVAQDTIATDNGDLTVTPVSHASFALTWNGVTIFNDPAPLGDDPAPTIAAFEALPDPQIILISDVHGDHFNADVVSAIEGDAVIVAPQAVADSMPEALKAQTTVLANGASTDVAGVTIEAVPMYNTTEDRLKFHAKGRGNGYVVTLGGKRIYIAGDTEDIPEMRALTGIDAAFLPMNLPYTMSVEQAADAVKAFKPAVVYPYHYGESDVAQFTALVGDASEVRQLDWYPKT